MSVVKETAVKALMMENDYAFRNENERKKNSKTKNQNAAIETAIRYKAKP